MTSRLHRLALFWQRFTVSQSSHEQLLWWWLRLLWFPPWQVKRQVPVGPYSLDLAIINKWIKVDIEVDGEHWHEQGDRPLRDRDRDQYMRRRGWRVIRFSADDQVELSAWSCALNVVMCARGIRRRKK